jgi:hypothetical protein
MTRLQKAKELLENWEEEVHIERLFEQAAFEVSQDEFVKDIGEKEFHREYLPELNKLIISKRQAYELLRGAHS